MYGNSLEKRRRKTLRNVLFASSIGLNYIIFDFEGSKYDISPTELSTLLNALENANGSSSKVIVTMASRAERFDVHQKHSDLREFIEISESFINLGFCLVAGNSAYLNEDEKSKSVFGIVELSQYISNNASNGLDIFIGAENCINPTIAILRRFAAGNGNKHTYIPFILKSEASVNEIQIIKHEFNTRVTFALYTPYLYTNSNNGITKKLCEYILRRKTVQGELGLTHNNCSELTTLNEFDGKNILLRNYADKLSLHGDFDAITNEIAALYKSGFSYIVGLTLDDSLKQILSLKRACLRANALFPA